MDARKDLYAFAMRGKEHSPANSEEASARINDYRASVLLEAANSLAALGPVDSLVSAPAAWTEAIETLRRIANQAPQGEGA